MVFLFVIYKLAEINIKNSTVNNSIKKILSKKRSINIQEPIVILGTTYKQLEIYNKNMSIHIKKRNT